MAKGRIQARNTFLFKVEKGQEDEMVATRVVLTNCACRDYADALVRPCSHRPGTRFVEGTASYCICCCRLHNPHLFI